MENFFTDQPEQGKEEQTGAPEEEYGQPGDVSRHFAERDDGKDRDRRSGDRFDELFGLIPEGKFLDIEPFIGDERYEDDW
jgi:hypothetical protein